MKNIKNSRMVQLVVFFVAIFVVNSFAMRMTEMGKKSAEKSAMRLQTLAQEKLQKERESQYQPGKYFIYEQGTSKGILVKAEMVKDNCKSIKVMVEDMGVEPNEIPLDYPVDTIKLAFGVLSDDVNIHGLLLRELIEVANVFNFLDVSADKINPIVANIKKDSKNIGAIAANEMMKQLHPDLQKLLLTNASVSYLKYCLIKKYAKNRKKGIPEHLWVFNPPTFAAFSSDMKHMVRVNMASQLVVYDLTNESEKVLVNDFGDINIVGKIFKSVAMSHDDKTIALCYEKGFTLLSIDDPNIFVTVDELDDVLLVVFSPDDKQIITVEEEDNISNNRHLNLWTLVTDREEILLKQIENYNADQIRLIYLLCSQFFKDKKVTLIKGSEEERIFMTLPKDMQKLLNDLLFSQVSQGWFFSWWK